MIRLLVVEDSMTVRQALVGIFSVDPGIEVVGVAGNGEEAVNAVMTLKPDVVTMDINMPKMDGFEATRRIMSTLATPIVIVTSKMDPRDSATIFRVMEAGALMVTAKPAPPGHPDHEASVRELIRTVKLMSEIKVIRRTLSPKNREISPPTATVLAAASPKTTDIRLVALGASTGGPPLLQSILSSLPTGFKAPVVIVQHMAQGFAEHFVQWLNSTSRLPVTIAGDGMPLSPGHAYLAPDGFQMLVEPGDRIRLSPDEPEHGQRPSVSALFRSVAGVYGNRAVGVLLTGMGIDGAGELKALREKGGITIAQNRESSVVFGMPGEAIRIGAADYVLTPEEIPPLLTELVNRSRRPAGHRST